MVRDLIAGAVTNYSLSATGVTEIWEPREGEPHNWDPEDEQGQDCRRLRVTVLYTTIEGTLAALTTGAELARGLAAEVEVLVTEQVPFHYLLDQPPVVAGFFERLCVELVRQAKLDLNSVDIKIYFCRDRLNCLGQMLRRRSLVVIGVKRCWWPRRERALQRALNEMGHDAVMVRVTSPVARVRSRAVLEAVLEGSHR
jgi:hypothetical protein